MHNIALALHHKGYEISGSDDNIFSPSKERLSKYNLLPKKIGWFPSKITTKLDAIILGMHAKEDNPELIKAKKLNIRIYSYPEYIYEQSKNKKRIVIGGSHGKTSITAMILHVLKKMKINCDYMVGAQLEGFNTMVKLTTTNPIIILEGDEYLSSAIDNRPKFHLYKPHIAVISGIAWDHINVFPTFEIYKNQFRIFKNMVQDTLIHNSQDKELNKIINEEKTKCKTIPYSTPKHNIKKGITYINKVKLLIFGNHNLQNINAAKLVCNEIGISDKDFYSKIATFKGASNRLQLIKKMKNFAIFKDFAHSPSKLKATCSAMKEQFKKRKLIACLELHTFSSLNTKFLNQYNKCMNTPDTAIIYFNPKNVSRKKIKPIKKEDIYQGFNRKDLLIFSKKEELISYIKKLCWKNKNLLVMSSGNFDNIEFNKLVK